MRPSVINKWLLDLEIVSEYDRTNLPNEELNYRLARLTRVITRDYIQNKSSLSVSPKRNDIQQLPVEYL